MTEEFPTKAYAKDEVIFQEGTEANVAYILKEGRIEISIMRKDQKIKLAELKPGAIFGEMALLLKDNKRTATATVLEKSVVIVIYKTAFQDYLSASSIVIRTLIGGLIERLQNTTVQLTESSSLTLSIGEIFNFLTFHKLTFVEKDLAIKTLSRCFHSTRSSVEEQLDQMVKSHLIEYGVNQGGKPMIKLHKNINYLEEHGEDSIYLENI